MQDRFQILSLDGGGIKGIFSAAVLAHLEEDFNIDITDYFDLITGTSTGGIIALGLGLGMRPRELLRFYVEKGPVIFRNGLLTALKQIWKNKYSSVGLERALKNCFGEALLGSSKKRLVIPSFNIDRDDVYLFKTSHNTKLERDYKVPVWKVAMATSAAPTYFPSFKKVSCIRLVDGGVWANNPVVVGIAEAVSMLGVPINTIRAFSLGTTDGIKIRSKRLNNGGYIQWALAAVDVIIRGQSIGANTQAVHLLGKENVLRIDPKVPDGLFKLDCLKEDELLSMAAHESRHLSPSFKKMFMDHISEKFEPCHNG